MKFLNKTARNILVLGVILILGGAMFGLVRGQLPLAQTAQEIATEVSTQTTDVSEPSPTATIWPTSAAVPVTTEPYRIIQITPIPGPTYTPTPEMLKASAIDIPVVTLISDEPLLSPELLSAVHIKENDYVWVQAWPTENEIIVGVGYYPNVTYWTVSLSTGQAQKLVNYQSELDVTAAVAELKQFDERVDYVSVSPDGQWAAWGLGETLLVKKSGLSEVPIDYLGTQYENFWGINQFDWSPQSDKFAYAIENGNQNRYEIRISSLISQETTIIPLKDTSPSHIAWSPDGQYLGFEMLEEPQSGISHIYVVKQDGNGLTQLTQHGNVGGPIHWSPVGESIIYTYDIGDGSRPWIVKFKKVEG